MRFDTHSSLVTRHPSLVVAAALAAASAHAALTFTIPAPNGVGDVVALTNALAQINALANNASGRFFSKIWLQPGLYDLAGIYMNANDHLKFEGCHGGLLAGLGASPGDVILKGEGEAGAHRVLSCGGSNYAWMTVSNLTVTGGWTITGDGGGIHGGGGTSRYIDLIVSNNYAKGSNGGGGGGLFAGRAINCLLADNRTNQRGGGLWCNGGNGQIVELVSGAWNCVFSNNVSTLYGGGVFGKGKYIGNTFIDNVATRGGAVYTSGGAFTWFNKFTNETEVTGCFFRGNDISEWGHGLAVLNDSSTRRLLVSNCVFSAHINTANGGDGVVNGCDMTDCTFTGNTRVSCLIYNCNLTRCLVADNTRMSGGDTFDKCSPAGAYTNVNCVFIRNTDSGYGHLTCDKILVNCTYADNVNVSGGNYGGFIRNSPAWNCLFAGNTIGGNRRDIRYQYLGFTYDLALTNCVITATYDDVSENFSGLANCRITKQIKVADETNGDYTPTTGSPLYDKAAQNAWILSLVGDRDIAGNRRVFGDGLDIGAFECQEYPPALRLIVR